MKSRALSVRLAVAALLVSLPAFAFPPQCECKHCYLNPDSMCLVGPLFFDCAAFYEDYCRLGASAAAAADASPAAAPLACLQVEAPPAAAER